MTLPKEAPMIERLALAIETAARQSLPWPDDEQHLGCDENGEDIFAPVTLESFVSNSYIGRDGANEVFKAAAKAAARAVLAELRRCQPAIRQNGALVHEVRGDPAAIWQLFIAALTEGEG